MTKVKGRAIGTYDRRPQLDNYVGFYGCSGRLVRLRWGGPEHGIYRDRGANMFATHNNLKTKKPPRGNEFNCPGCGYDHKVSIHWRKEFEGENIQEDLVLYE